MLAPAHQSPDGKRGGVPPSSVVVLSASTTQGAARPAINLAGGTICPTPVGGNRQKKTAVIRAESQSGELLSYTSKV